MNSDPTRSWPFPWSPSYCHLYSILVILITHHIYIIIILYLSYLFLVIKVLQTCLGHSLGHLPILIFLSFHICSLWLMCYKHAMIIYLNIYPLWYKCDAISVLYDLCAANMSLSPVWIFTCFDINVMLYMFFAIYMLGTCRDHLFGYLLALI